MSPNGQDSEPSSLFAQRVTRRAALTGTVLAAAGVATRAPINYLARAQSATPSPVTTPTALEESGLLASLADAGIAVYENALDPTPMVPVESPGPIALLGVQFRAMLFEANHGGGVLGADLDRLTLDPAFWPWAGKPVIPNPLDTHSSKPDSGALPIPPSTLVAAYIQAGDSPGAKIARGLFPKLDVKQSGEIVIPGLVLALFAAEIAREEQANAGSAWAPSSGAVGMRALLLEGGTCSAVQGFIDQVLNALFGALHVDLGSSVPGKILGGIINFLLTAAQKAVKEALNVLTAPVLSVVKTIAGVVGTASIVISAIRPWTILLTPSPASTRFSVGAEAPIKGLVDCTVDVGGFDEWPADIADCAAAAGVPLPPLKPADAPCRWELVGSNGALIVPEDQPAKLDQGGHAALTYHTLSEDEETAKGNAVQGWVKVTAAIERPAVADLQKTLSNVLFAQLPTIVATFVRPILGPAVDSLLARIATLTESQASAIVNVTFHTPKEKTPTPEPTKKPKGDAGTIAVTFTNGADVPFPLTINLKATSCDGVKWKGSMSIDLHIDGGVAKVDMDDTSPCAWSFAKGNTTKTNVGPFKSQIVYALNPPDPYTIVLHMTVVKSGGKKGSPGAMSFSFSATVAIAGDGTSGPLTGGTNMDTPIAITPGASNC